MLEAKLYTSAQSAAKRLSQMPPRAEAHSPTLSEMEMDFDMVQHAAQAIHPPMALSPPSSAQPTQTTMPIQAGVQNEYHRLTRYLPQDGRDAFIGPMPGTVSVSLADRAQCMFRADEGE